MAGRTLLHLLVAFVGLAAAVPMPQIKFDPVPSSAVNTPIIFSTSTQAAITFNPIPTSTRTAIIFTPIPTSTRTVITFTPLPSTTTRTVITFSPIPTTTRPPITFSPIPTTTRPPITFSPIPTTTRPPITFSPIPTTTRPPITFSPIPTTTTRTPITLVPIPQQTSCVQGGGGEMGGYMFEYDLSVPSLRNPPNGTMISSTWEKAHQIGTLSMTLGVDQYLYGSFKCQYNCNSLSGCVSFAAWSVTDSVRPARSHFECHLYDTVVKPSDFVRVGLGSNKYTIQAFNKLCKYGKREEKRDAIFNKDGSWRCHGEYCCTDNVSCPITSDCAELGLIEAKPDQKWENYYLSGDWVLENRWAGFVHEAEYTEANLKQVEQQCKMACIKNLGKCTGYTVAHGLPDPANAYPEFTLSGKPQHGFICNLLSKKIDTTKYHKAEGDTWAHFRGVDVGCTSPLIS